MGKSALFATLALLSALAVAHDMDEKQCDILAHVPGFAAQDRARGLTEKESLERNAKSIAECMRETPDSCAFKDREDFLRAMNFIEQIYAVPLAAGEEIDPKVPYSQILGQCVDAHRKANMPALPGGVHTTGPQIGA